MVDRRLPVPLARRKAHPPADRPRGLPHVYRGRAGRRLDSLFDMDHAEPRREGRFRWLISTCLGAAIGAVAIVVVIYGSSDPGGESQGLIPAIERMRQQVETAPATPAALRLPGLAWATPRSDRLVFMSGAASTRQIIHDSIRQRRSGRDYIKPKPYTRIVARLAAVSPGDAPAIPPFNPLKLYATSRTAAAADPGARDGAARTDVTVRVVELLGGTLPSEDGQELDAREIAAIVEVAEREDVPLEILEEQANGAAETPATGGAPLSAAASLPPNTTEIAKPDIDEDVVGTEAEAGEVRKVTVAPGDTLERILTRAGAEPWQARAMIEPAAGILGKGGLTVGQEVRLTLAPSLTQPNKMEPVRFGVYAGGSPLVVVARNATGQFAALAGGAGEAQGERLALGDADLAEASSLYAGFFFAGLAQGLPQDMVFDIMRVHAYETDFRRRVRLGDSVELFFDTKENAKPSDPPGELLSSSITAGGETKRFYRFRSRDGAVDFFDENGNNSKKFLMRKPVRGSEVRLTSGFGMRVHPALNVPKMHWGLDWAAPPGTPVLAAGNGTIEEAGRKGNYGLYVRIRHANGYQTAYAHMLRIADGIAPAVKVTQGNVIGYVGSTGLSTGAHLHFEILADKRLINPSSIENKGERQLKGRELAEFSKERARIDDLMRRQPVSSISK